MRIAIIQEKIAPYRIPFFTQLNEKLKGGLTVFSGEQAGDFTFHHQHIRIRRKGNWVLPLGLDKTQLAQFDVVVMVFDLRWLTLYPLLLCHHRKVVLWGQGMGSRQMLSSLRTMLINRSIGFLAYEENSENYFIQRGIAPEKLAHVGNTVAVGEHGLSARPRRYFIYMGRLQARKCLDQVIRAFALMPRAMQEQSGLLFLGDGDIRSELEALAQSSGVQKYCRFVPGSYDPQVVKGYLDEAIAYVSPGPVGLGVLHAFGCGVPVITRRNVAHGPEVENVDDGRNGFLTADSDQAIMEAMQHYLTSSALHRSHCEAAYQRYAEHRTMDKMVARYATALQGFSQQSL
ncbi:MAG: glycosyltransferase family 4 protein [Gammaproteobacteria bacterium]|nr:glycosyltransferase family 4 protein [Gammaproteobacteria bacterium]MBQ0840678.1 glycosyltransferase family 4 protein [Gammaproteobacteria bacterium]